MDKQHIQQVLIEVLTEIQTNSGLPVIEIDEDTRPIGDLPGFDSLTGIEATVELTHRLGHQMTDENIFVSAKGTRAAYSGGRGPSLRDAQSRGGNQ